MIFKQHEQVLNGTKTQTRRIIKPNELASGNRVGRPRINAVWIDTKGVHDRKWEQHGFIRAPLLTLERLYKLKWHVAMGFYADKTYAVQPGRGKRAVGRIRITEIRRERLQEISEGDAIAEGVGYVSKEYPEEDWYIWTVNPGPEVSDWGYSNSPIRMFDKLWDSIHKKPGTRWADNPEVWVLTFEVVDGT